MELLSSSLSSTLPYHKLWMKKKELEEEEEEGVLSAFFALPSSLPKVIAAVHVVADHHRVVNKKRTT